MILIGYYPGHEFDLCAIHITKLHIASPAYIGCVGITIAHDLFEFLFVKIHVDLQFNAQIPMMFQIYFGAESEKIRQARRMAGPIHSNCPLCR